MNGLTCYSPMRARNVNEKMVFGRTYRSQNARRKRANTLIRISLRHFCQEMLDARAYGVRLVSLRVHGFHALMRVHRSVHNIELVRLNQHRQLVGMSPSICLKTPCSQNGLRNGNVYAIVPIGRLSLNTRLILWRFFDHSPTGTLLKSDVRFFRSRMLSHMNLRVTTSEIFR